MFLNRTCDKGHVLEVSYIKYVIFIIGNTVAPSSGGDGYAASTIRHGLLCNSDSVKTQETKSLVRPSICPTHCIEQDRRNEGAVGYQESLRSSYQKLEAATLWDQSVRNIALFSLWG